MGSHNSQLHLDRLPVDTGLAGGQTETDKLTPTDLGIVKATMGKSYGTSGYEWKADFNEDGTVNQADLNILNATLGSSYWYSGVPNNSGPYYNWRANFFGNGTITQAD